MTTAQDKTRHTSGPWQSVTAEDWDGATIQTQGGRIVACCDGCDIPGATREPTTEEAKANARLIAAAPELLDALRWFADELPSIIRTSCPEGVPMIVSDAHDKARAAIAKAEGREP